ADNKEQCDKHYKHAFGFTRITNESSNMVCTLPKLYKSIDTYINFNITNEVFMDNDIFINFTCLLIVNCLYLHVKSTLVFNVILNQKYLKFNRVTIYVLEWYMLSIFEHAEIILCTPVHEEDEGGKHFSNLNNGVNFPSIFLHNMPTVIRSLQMNFLLIYYRQSIYIREMGFCQEDKRPTNFMFYRCVWIPVLQKQICASRSIFSKICILTNFLQTKGPLPNPKFTFFY
ncbi:hypothetical protein ACJX0J_015925, partial [Zea mays]